MSTEPVWRRPDAVGGLHAFHPHRCASCGRNLAQDTTHVSGWDGERVTFYCAGYPCDPRRDRAQ